MSRVKSCICFTDALNKICQQQQTLTLISMDRTIKADRYYHIEVHRILMCSNQKIINFPIAIYKIQQILHNTYKYNTLVVYEVITINLTVFTYQPLHCRKLYYVLQYYIDTRMMFRTCALNDQTQNVEIKAFPIIRNF